MYADAIRYIEVAKVDLQWFINRNHVYIYSKLPFFCSTQESDIQLVAEPLHQLQKHTLIILSLDYVHIGKTAQDVEYLSQSKCHKINLNKFFNFPNRSLSNSKIQFCARYVISEMITSNARQLILKRKPNFSRSIWNWSHWMPNLCRNSTNLLNGLAHLWNCYVMVLIWIWSRAKPRMR